MAIAINRSSYPPPNYERTNQLKAIKVLPRKGRSAKDHCFDSGL
jgi:hypothetical protein